MEYSEGHWSFCQTQDQALILRVQRFNSSSILLKIPQYVVIQHRPCRCAFFMNVEACECV